MSNIINTSVSSVDLTHWNIVAVSRPVILQVDSNFNVIQEGIQSSVQFFFVHLLVLRIIQDIGMRGRGLLWMI